MPPLAPRRSASWALLSPYPGPPFPNYLHYYRGTVARANTRMPEARRD